MSKKYVVTMIVQTPDGWVDENDVESVLYDVINTVTLATVLNIRSMPAVTQPIR